jgi:hypothetical protein
MNGFLTPLKVQLLDPTEGGTWWLVAPLCYKDKTGRIWVVPVGFTTDFASVPRLPVVYWLFGNTAHAPSVLHDYLIVSARVPRSQADKLFAEAMESVKMPRWRIGPMFRAVSAYTKLLKDRFFPPDKG